MGAKCEIKMAAGVVGETNERSRSRYKLGKKRNTQREYVRICLQLRHVTIEQTGDETIVD